MCLKFPRPLPPPPGLFSIENIFSESCRSRNKIPGGHDAKTQQNFYFLALMVERAAARVVKIWLKKTVLFSSRFSVETIKSFPIATVCLRTHMYAHHVEYPVPLSHSGFRKPKMRDYLESSKYSPHSLVGRRLFLAFAVAAAKTA